jgi:hypothetical protein
MGHHHKQPAPRAPGCWNNKLHDNYCERVGIGSRALKGRLPRRVLVSPWYVARFWRARDEVRYQGWPVSRTTAESGGYRPRKGGQTLVTLVYTVTPYRVSVDRTRGHVTYHKFLYGNVTGMLCALSVFGRRIKGMIRLRPEQVWTCNLTSHHRPLLSPSLHSWCFWVP